MENITTNKRGAVEYMLDSIKTTAELGLAGELDIDGQELEDLSTMICQLEELDDEAHITIFESPMSASGLAFRVERSEQ